MRQRVIWVDVGRGGDIFLLGTLKRDGLIDILDRIHLINGGPQEIQDMKIQRD